MVATASCVTAMGRIARSRPVVGPVEVRRGKVRDRGDVGAEEKIRFTSSILPKWARRTKSLDALLPVLYLRGVSTGDFQEAPRRPLGQGRAEPVASRDLAADGGMAGGLRCLAETRPVGAAIRIRVGGWGLLAGPDGTGAECMLVLIGATPEGKKELVGFQTGVRESAQSWRELLIDIKQRGLEIAPDLAVGDGALGLLEGNRGGLSGCQGTSGVGFNKTANVLNKSCPLGPINMEGRPS